MRRLTLIGLTGLLVLSIAAPATAGHGPQFTATGTVLVGDPASAVIGGVTENVAPCDPGSAANGVDGIWYDIQGFGVHTATLTMDSTADFDIYWYDESCQFIDDVTMAANFVGETEMGTVPFDARYAVVDLFIGGAATFNLTIG